MLLAIDAGNSFVKLGFHDGAAWQDTARIALEDFGRRAAQLAERSHPGGIVISNVAGDAFGMPMRRLLQQWQCDALWLTPSARACGVINGYRVPAQLGSDRWACLIAARQVTRRDAVIGSIGTAVTLDVLGADGRFRGGVILPGLALMQKGLWQGTAGISSGLGQYEPFPTSTADGVYTGALLAIAGAVERMHAATGGAPELILTGGGAPLLVPLLRPPLRVIDNLVLEGLLCIAREEGML